MNIFQRLLGRSESKAVIQAPSSTTAFFARNNVPSELRTSPEDAMSISVVYACVRVIAESLAASPWNVLTKDSSGRSQIRFDDPLFYILNTRANRDIGAQSFKEGLISNALIYGDGYAEIIFDQAGRVVGLSLIPTTQVTPFRGTGGERLATDDRRTSEPGELIYQISPTSHTGRTQQTVYLPQDQVFHLKSLASVNALMGDGPVTRGAAAMAAAKAAEQYAINYYANNASLGGILTLPRTLKPEEQKELEDRFSNERAGSGRAFKTLFLGPGSDFKQLDGNAGSSQVVESRQYSTEDIARYFGVPGHLIGVQLASQGWGRNLSDLYNVFVRNTLIPWSKRLEQEANFKLCSQRAPWKTTALDLSWLTQGDAKTRADVYDVYLKNGTMSVNEVREAEGMNNIGNDGDLHLLAGSWVELDEEQIAIQPEPAAEAPADGSESADEGDQGETTDETSNPSDEAEATDNELPE